MCRSEGWSTGTWKGRLDAMLFERTALSRQPDKLLTSELATLRDQGVLAPNFVLKDPYVLDLLVLRDRYLEKDLEDAILRELENFLLELGEFKAADKGQMELYLRWLAKNEQEPGEAPTLGIILCTGKNREQIELLDLDQSGIHVAEYLTGLPSRQMLEQKLHETVSLLKPRLQNRPDSTETEIKSEGAAPRSPQGNK